MQRTTCTVSCVSATVLIGVRPFLSRYWIAIINSYLRQNRQGPCPCYFLGLVGGRSWGGWSCVAMRWASSRGRTPLRAPHGREGRVEGRSTLMPSSWACSWVPHELHSQHAGCAGTAAGSLWPAREHVAGTYLPGLGPSAWGGKKKTVWRGEADLAQETSHYHYHSINQADISLGNRKSIQICD